MSSKLIPLVALAAVVVLAAADVGLHGRFSDRYQRRQVERALVKAGYNTADDTPVRASVDDSWCLLEGKLRNPADRERIADAVLRRVRGLRGLTNNLEVVGCEEWVLAGLKDFVGADPEEARISYVLDPPCSVTLTGWVRSEEIKEGVGRIIRSAPGVRELRNELEVRPPEVVVQDRIITILRLQNIYFDSDEATIRPESLPALDEIAAVLKEHPNTRLRIEGHTDSVGPTDYNQQLSQARAETVRNALQERGIAPARLEAAGYGESQPVVKNDTPEGRAENRRIEFKAL